MMIVLLIILNAIVSLNYVIQVETSFSVQLTDKVIAEKQKDYVSLI
jgi:hypothetical protein